MKSIVAFQIGGQSAMIARLIWWQFFLGTWHLGESGFSGFLAPTVPKAWAEESGLASKLVGDDVVGLKGVTHHSGKNASQKPASHAQVPLMRQETDVLSHDTLALGQEKPVASLIDVPVPQIVEEEDWSYKRKTVPHKAKSKEGKLINFMRKYAVGREQVDCMILCRYGERVRHSWKHCLSQCVAKTDKRESFIRMLPDEDSDAKALDYEVPPELEEDLKRIRSEMKRNQRQGEL
jgi:hypothetical protein|mmetsp:Transcript_9415/g.15390  ORF Transcript_9415/g.15390 Transcript_9415/m.15390 type:complete len:235 (-) Transcript_9415:155-859(-)